MLKALCVTALVAIGCAAVAPSTVFAQNSGADKPVGTVTDVQVSENNDSVRCGGGTCSPDGKWRASVYTLQVAAQPGFRLQNAHISCAGAGCPWTDQSGPFLQGDGYAATATVRNWGLPVTWTLQADVYKR
jgi:hypothetical protein